MFETDFIRPFLRETLLSSCMRGYFTELGQLTEADHVHALQAMLLMSYLTGQILRYYWGITGQFVPCLPTWMRLDIFGLLTMLTHLISIDSPFVQYHRHSPAYGMHLAESEDIAPIEPVQYVHVANALAHLSRSGGLAVLIQALGYPFRLGLSSLSTFLLFFQAAVPFLSCTVQVPLMKSVYEVISYLERCFEAADGLSAFEDEDCSASLSDPPLPHVLLSSILSTCSRIGNSLGVGDSIDEKVGPLQRELILRLLRSGNFTRQLAAVKDLDQVVLATAFAPPVSGVDNEKEMVEKSKVEGVMQWMHSNEVVKLMLSSNLHQHSYAEAAVKVLATLIRNGQLDEENCSELEPLWSHAKDASTFDEIRSNSCAMLGMLFPLLPSEATLHRLVGPDGLDASSALHVLGSIPSLAKSTSMLPQGESLPVSESCQDEENLEKARRVIDAICDVLLDAKAASVVSTFHTLEQACLRHSTSSTMPELVGQAMGRCIGALQGEQTVSVSAAILLNRLLTVVVPTIKLNDPKSLYQHMKVGVDNEELELLDMAMDVAEKWMLLDDADIKEPQPPSSHRMVVGAFMRLIASIIATRLSTVGEAHLCRVLKWAQNLKKFPNAAAACWELLTVLLHGTARRDVIDYETARDFLCKHLCTVAPESVVGSAAWTCLVVFMAAISNWERDLLVSQAPQLLTDLITVRPGSIWNAERVLLLSLMLEGEESVSNAACNLLSELVACRAREQLERDEYVTLLGEYTDKDGELMRKLVRDTEEMVGLAVGKINESSSAWYVCVAQDQDHVKRKATDHVAALLRATRTKRYLRFLERLVRRGILVDTPHGVACNRQPPSQHHNPNLAQDSPAGILSQQGTVYRVAIALAQTQLEEPTGESPGFDAQAWRLLEALPTCREAMHDVTRLLNNWPSCTRGMAEDIDRSLVTVQVFNLLTSGPAVVLRYLIETTCALVNARTIEDKRGEDKDELGNPIDVSSNDQSLKEVSFVFVLLKRVNPGGGGVEVAKSSPSLLLGPPHTAAGIHLATLTLLSAIFRHDSSILIPVSSSDANLAGRYAKSLIIRAAAAIEDTVFATFEGSSDGSSNDLGLDWSRLEPAASDIALKGIQLLKLCCFEFKDLCSGSLPFELEPLLDDAFAHAMSILITLTSPDLCSAAVEWLKLAMTLPAESAGLHWAISNVLTPVLLGPRPWEGGEWNEEEVEEEEVDEEEDERNEEGGEEKGAEVDNNKPGEDGQNEGEGEGEREGEREGEGDEDEEEWSDHGEETGAVLDALLLEAVSRDPEACELLLDRLVHRFKRAFESEGGQLKGIVNTILLLLRALDRREIAEDLGRYIIARVLYPELILLSEARTSSQPAHLPALALRHQDAILKSARIDPDCREACIDLLLDLITHDLSCWNSCTAIIADALDAGVAALPKPGINRPVPIANGRQHKGTGNGRNKGTGKGKRKIGNSKKRSKKKIKGKIREKSKSGNKKKRVRLLKAKQNLVTSKEYSLKSIKSRAPIRHRVGLTNGGATCYMNATFQQLFAQPIVRRLILEADIPSSGDEVENPSVFAQVRTMFSRLAGGVEAWYEPRGFWRAFKDYEGNPINIREHQDAYEFFTRLQDAVDETLASAGRPKAIHSALGGTFVQVITVVGSRELSSQREEEFYQISLDVRGKNDLLDSLDAYVAPELLDGPNRWYCEDLGRKVDAEKRTLIKRLPHTLMIHLKRFEWDHETLTRWKVKDRFEFPIDLDLRPYTLVTGEEKADDGTCSDYNYSLCGIIVHSGTAFAGHYYSYVKDRDDGTWNRFDDATVQPWNLNDVEDDCFGGSNRPNSAYMLLYERRRRDVDGGAVVTGMPMPCGTTPGGTEVNDGSTNACNIFSLPQDLALEVAHHNIVSVATAHILGREIMDLFDGLAKETKKAAIGLRPRKLARPLDKQVGEKERGLGLGLGLARLVSPRTAHADLDRILLSAAKLCIQYVCTVVARGPYALATAVVPQQRGRAPLPLAINAVLARPAVALGLASSAASTFLTALTCCHTDVRDVAATWCALLCETLETGYGQAIALEAVTPLFDTLMACLCSQQNKIANIVGMNLWTWEEVLQAVAGMVLASEAMGTLVVPHTDTILTILGPALIQGFWSLKEEDREDYDFGARYLDLLSCLLRRWGTDDLNATKKDAIHDGAVDGDTNEDNQRYEMEGGDVNPFCILEVDGLPPPVAPEGIWDWLFEETTFLRKLLMPGCLRDQGGMSLLMWLLWNNVERAQHIAATLLLHIELDCTDADLAAELVTLMEAFTLGDDLGMDRYADVLAGIDERVLAALGIGTRDEYEDMDIDADDTCMPMGLLEYVRLCRSEYRRVMIMRLVVSMYEADPQAWKESALAVYPDGGRRWLLWAATCVEDFGKILQEDGRVKRVWEDLSMQVPGEREVFGVQDLEDRLLAAAESLSGNTEGESDGDGGDDDGGEDEEGSEDGEGDGNVVITAHHDEGKGDEDQVAEIDLDK